MLGEKESPGAKTVESDIKRGYVGLRPVSEQSGGIYPPRETAERKNPRKNPGGKEAPRFISGGSATFLKSGRIEAHKDYPAEKNRGENVRAPTRGAKKENERDTLRGEKDSGGHRVTH